MTQPGGSRPSPKPLHFSHPDARAPPRYMSAVRLEYMEADTAPMKYRCTMCGYIYDEEKEGVAFADLPDDWICPVCGEPKSEFVAVE